MKRLAASIAALSLLGVLLFHPEKAKNNIAFSAHNVKGCPKGTLGHFPKASQPKAPWEADDLSSLIAFLDQMPDDEARDEAVQKAAARVDDKDIPSVLNSLKGIQSPVAASLRIELVARWAANNPAAAGAWAAAQSENRAQLLQLVAVTWSEMDFESACKWADGLAEGADRTCTEIALGYEAARAQPLVAIEMMNQLEPNTQRDAVFVYAVSQWASAEPEQALEWAANLPESSLRDRLISAAAISAAKSCAPAAANLLATTVVENSDLENSAVAIVQRWAQKEPAAAAAWIEEFPETTVKQDATENLMALWVPQDKQAAWKWASRQQGSQQTSAISAYKRALLQITLVVNQSADRTAGF